MKTIKSTNNFFKITTILLALALASVFFMGMKADVSPNIPLGYSATDVTITIQKPKTWLTKETQVKITVESNLKIAKVEAKTANNGQWQDITDDMDITQGSLERGTSRTASLLLSDNCTVYVQVTDKNGYIYTKSRYIEAFDRTNPTVKAKIDKTLLRVEADDDLSGVSAIYVDGERYDDLLNGTLDIKVKKLGKDYEDISIQAVDFAGNKSSITTLKNPNYKEKPTDTAPTAVSTTTEKLEGTASTTTETSGTATGTNITAPTSTTTSATTGTAAGGGTGTSANPATASDNASSSESPLFGTFEDSNKQFMSIVTKDGQVFYMIIDHDKPSENVYLLTEATEVDLQSFSPDTEGSMTEEYPEYIGKDKPEEEISFVDDTPEVPPVEEPPDDTEQNEVPSEAVKDSSPGTYIFIIILVALVAGAGYYFKIYKPKKELAEADDLDDYEFREETDEQDDSDEVIFEE